MERAQKHEFVASLNSELQGAASVVIMHYKGMTVAEITNLRVKARAAGVTIKVAKNLLAKRAFQGTDFEGLADLMTGPTAITYANDPVSAAKTLVDFAKNNDKLKVIGGALGANILDAKGVEALAKMPSLDELRAKIIGLLNAPATRIATILQAPAGQVARVVGAYSQKEQ